MDTPIKIKEEDQGEDQRRKNKEEEDRKEDKTMADSGQEIDKEDNYLDYSDLDFIY